MSHIKVTVQLYSHGYQPMKEWIVERITFRAGDRLDFTTKTSDGCLVTTSLCGLGGSYMVMVIEKPEPLNKIVH